MNYPRLLQWQSPDIITFAPEVRPDQAERRVYAILSHTWSENGSVDEVLYGDILNDSYRLKKGNDKLQFCAKRADEDGLKYFWIDTCCIDKEDKAEFDKAIHSMYDWYANATRCYVFLSDVQSKETRHSHGMRGLERARWFTRGWTLQELLAPKVVHLYSSDGSFLEDRKTLAEEIGNITSIDKDVLRGERDVADVDPSEIIRWTEGRFTKERNDELYCLLGLLNIDLPMDYDANYGEALKEVERKIRILIESNICDAVNDGRYVRVCVETSRRYVMIYLDRELYLELRADNRCLWCGEEGHAEDSCWGAKSRVTTSRFAEKVRKFRFKEWLCLTCGSSGHRARFCPF